jgi:hypothetical protein
MKTAFSALTLLGIASAVGIKNKMQSPRQTLAQTFTETSTGTTHNC